MSKITLKAVAKRMKDIDFTMLLTLTESGEIAGRPMSNNRDVEYDGDSYYFCSEDTRTVEDIKRHKKVGLALQGRKGLLGKPPLMVSVEGDAELIRDKKAFAAHWNKDLERWFEDSVDTPGLVMIKVSARRIHYWDGEEEGEFTTRRRPARRS